MNVYSNRDDGLLHSIEQAMGERTQFGRANEVRHGLVAQVANATPPVNEAFRRTLRARILAGETKREGLGMTSQGRALPANVWRSALPTLTAILVVMLVFAYTRIQEVEWTGVLVGRPSSEGHPATEDFDALGEALNGASGPRTVLVYPDRASPIAERVRHETMPLVLDKGTTPAAIRGALGMILPSSGFVDLVMAGAKDDDTTRQVRAVIEQTLYRLYRPSGQPDTEVYGELEHSTFLVGPADVVLEPIGAVFQGGIELVAGSVLDDPQPATALRMAFDWRIQEPVSGSLVMFVHLMRDDVELVAQRDAVPGNGLFPVAEWSVGELVRDQFALLLPPTLPAGEYEIRVGVYDAATLMRHGVIHPEGGTYVVVQQ